MSANSITIIGNFPPPPPTAAVAITAYAQQNGYLYFSTDGGYRVGNHVWRTDGTPGGTVDLGTVANVNLPSIAQLPPYYFTSNYGEAGAIDHLGAAVGLSRAYSGHNSYSDWGIPPESASPVVVIGFTQRSYVDTYWNDCKEAARIDNGVGAENEEQGVPIWVCAGPTRPWADMWGELTSYG